MHILCVGLNHNTAAKAMQFRPSRRLTFLDIGMCRNAESIRKSELEKSLRHMKNISEAEQANIEVMTRAIVKKILHTPTVNLRSASKTSRISEYAEFMGELFGLK